MSDSEPKPLFKKRAKRPPPRQRESEDAVPDEPTPETREGSEGADEEKMTIEELLELRKLRRQRQGIDSTKLNAGISKKKKKKTEEEEEEEQYGLRPGGQRREVEEDEDNPDEDVGKKIVKSNNFTQQTNKLDVDKHMMKYIEEELEKRRGTPNGSAGDGNASSSDPYAELFRISEKYKLQKKQELEEGSVTNSSAMLTAIPEVDLGMDTRLKNIEETEKAKRTVSETLKDSRHKPREKNDERHLAATRFFNPRLKVQSDADAMRDAKLEAMGLPPEMDTRGYIKERDNRREVATDEQVMERFKKRMRK
ncbi:hepatocellular carcinoma-associated antigen 59 [Rhizoctonia solani 123E]|uniref:Hepatocellular carcinoma-associated antigen 59 n=1 Tax=Rhizoctonia solani 123E TaxID=1423351 RepID=A0A074SWU7_9AGAM|nr:hepatocellular carcinoma-associated antigen 59 [Rhizoctonia solani 123E]